MSRPPFSVSVLSPWKVTLPIGEPLGDGVADAFTASESTSGSSAERRPSGWRDPKPYSMTYRSYRRALGICRYHPPGAKYIGQVYTGVVGGSRFNSLDHFNSLVTEDTLSLLAAPLANRALIKARSKLKRSDVNLGVAFAERDATARLLGDTATRLGKSFNNLKRGRVRAAMRDLGILNSRREPRGSNVPNKWLELQYGWKPLLSDVFGACQALSKQDRSNWRVTAKASELVRSEYRAIWDSFDAGSGEAQAECGAFVRIDALPGNDLTMSLSSLGVTNPLLIAWELVPYSFVVDWALPVGAWLESIDAMLGYEDSSYSASTLIRCSWHGTGRRRPPDQNGFVVDNVYQESKKFVSLVREASNSVPLPHFPSLKDPRSLGHMANGLALLSSAFSRR